MNTVVIWILIATTSPIAPRAGTFDVVERFATAEDCAAAIREIRSHKDGIAASYFEYRCIQAKVAAK